MTATLDQLAEMAQRTQERRAELADKIREAAGDPARAAEAQVDLIVDVSIGCALALSRPQLTPSELRTVEDEVERVKTLTAALSLVADALRLRKELSRST